MGVLGCSVRCLLQDLSLDKMHVTATVTGQGLNTIRNQNNIPEYLYIRILFSCTYVFIKLQGDGDNEYIMYKYIYSYDISRIYIYTYNVYMFQPLIHQCLPIFLTGTLL